MTMIRTALTEGQVKAILPVISEAWMNEPDETTALLLNNARKALSACLERDTSQSGRP